MKIKQIIKKSYNFILSAMLLFLCFFLSCKNNMKENVFLNLTILFGGINLVLIFLTPAIRKFENNRKSADSFFFLVILAITEVIVYYFLKNIFSLVFIMLIKSAKIYLLLCIYNYRMNKKVFIKEKFVIVSISVLCDIFCFIFRDSACYLVAVPFIFMIYIYIRIHMHLKENKTLNLMQTAHIFFSCHIMSLSLSMGDIRSGEVIIFGFFCFSVCAVLWCYAFLKDFADDRMSKIENAEKNLNLKNEEMAVMLSQIKPHFIYNTLNTIQYLCRTDAELAADTVSDFADYLRTNLNFDSQKQLVTFEEELEHINKYLKIEKLRFKHRLKVKYEIEEDNFLVPMLSIQPVVENAVKHGISKRLNGGVIKIKAYMGESDYVVEIKDNGIGISKKEKEKTRKSLGLINIKNRIEVLLGGRMILKSKENIGTEVVIYFPIERNLKEVENYESSIYR